MLLNYKERAFVLKLLEGVNPLNCHPLTIEEFQEFKYRLSDPGPIGPIPIKAG